MSDTVDLTLHIQKLMTQEEEGPFFCCKCAAEFKYAE